MLSCAVAYSLPLILLFSCQSQARQKILNGFAIKNPSVPDDEILVGNPKRDGIPAIDNPEFVSVQETNFMSPDDQVVGVEINGAAKAYPLKILTWHEIVNDSLGGEPIVVTYCPLCRSAYVFERKIAGQALSFGVSGLLYNSNVIMYDRQTESLWSQVATEAINGPLKGKELQQITAATSTSWQAWSSQRPETQILSTSTGYRRNYQRSPYGDYASSRDVLFPVSETSGRFHPKALVAGVEVDGNFKAYPLPELNKLSGNQLQDRFAGQELVIRFDADAQSVDVSDRQGNKIPANVLYWFAWYAFHPETEVYQAK